MRRYQRCEGLHLGGWLGGQDVWRLRVGGSDCGGQRAAGGALMFGTCLLGVGSEGRGEGVKGGSFPWEEGVNSRFHSGCV